MRKINLFLTLIAVVMLVGLTNCKKTDNDNPTITKYVGTVNGSFTTQDAGIKVSKDLAPNQLVTRNWSMYAKNSPFYNNQQFALINGSEFSVGSDAQIWWSTSGNNPLTLTVDQTYSSLIPTEPVRLVMEGFGANDTRAAYLGIVDFDPTVAQFPLTVASKSLGDILIVNADALTQSGGSPITVTVSFNAYAVNMTATKSKSQLSTSSITGVSGVLDFIDIQYDQQPSPTYSKSDFSVGAGDYVVFSDIASKIKGDITIKITQNGNIITLTSPAGALGQGTKITLSISKVDGVSHTLGVTDQGIVVNSVPISVSGLNTGNNGGGGQNPPITPNITLNSSTNYTLYEGVAENASALQISVSLSITGIFTQINDNGNNPHQGEILDMGVCNLITNNTLTGPPDFSNASVFLTLNSGHSYIIRYRKVTDYQLAPAPMNYNYGIFYVNSYNGSEANITYQGPFTN